jgi:hypothetical protein
MGRTIKTRCKEHMRHICLGQVEKSSVVEYKFETGHNVRFSSTTILDKAMVHMDQLVKEAPKQKLQRGRGLRFQSVLFPVTNMIKQ